MFLVARGGIELPTQGFSSSRSIQSGRGAMTLEPSRRCVNDGLQLARDGGAGNIAGKIAALPRSPLANIELGGIAPENMATAAYSHF